MVKSIVIGILMPILVFTLLLYTCYQYIFNVLDFSFHNNNDSILSVSIACVLCFLSLLTYSLIMLKSPSNLKFSLENKIKEYPYIALSTEKGEPLYCQKCKTLKPARTHHCKECNQCAPKMDHHCIWINGCVDANNYKLFFLFVSYVALYSLFIEFTIIPKLLNEIKSKIGNITLNFCWKLYKAYLASIYHLWKNILLMIWEKKWIPLFTGVQSIGLDHISKHWYVITALGFLFGLTLTGFAAVHFWYIIKNQTSIEYIADKPIFVRVDFDETGNNYFEVIKIKSDKNMYDLGIYHNWCSVMGSNPILWLVPITSNNIPAEYPFNLKFRTNIINLTNKHSIKAQTNKD